MIRALLTRDRGNLEIKNNRCTNIRFFFLNCLEKLLELQKNHSNKVSINIK